MSNRTNAPPKVNTVTDLPPNRRSLRRALEDALFQEGERLRRRAPADPDLEARLEQLAALWRSGYRGLEPTELPPSTPADRLAEARAALG